MNLANILGVTSAVNATMFSTLTYAFRSGNVADVTAPLTGVASFVTFLRTLCQSLFDFSCPDRNLVRWFHLTLKNICVAIARRGLG